MKTTLIAGLFGILLAGCAPEVVEYGSVHRSYGYYPYRAYYRDPSYSVVVREGSDERTRYSGRTNVTVNNNYNFRTRDSSRSVSRTSPSRSASLAASSSSRTQIASTQRGGKVHKWDKKRSSEEQTR